MAITRRQHEVYDFISRFVAEHGYSPSFEEIGKGLDLTSLATVHKHISNLEKKGLLTRDYNRSRSIDLLPPKGKLKQSMAVNTALVLPLLGRIAAGRPIEAVASNETISLADFVRSKEVFVLEVRGDSMQDEAILDGDYVLVEKTKTAHNGDIVVALLESSACCTQLVEFSAAAKSSANSTCGTTVIYWLGAKVIALALSTAAIAGLPPMSGFVFAQCTIRRSTSSSSGSSLAVGM